MPVPRPGLTSEVRMERGPCFWGALPNAYGVEPCDDGKSGGLLYPIAPAMWVMPMPARRTMS